MRESGFAVGMVCASYAHMGIAQFIVAYSVSWWLVLFMLLPIGATPEANPQPGNAPSAPAKPNLKKKFKWATGLALLPTLLIYLLSTQAFAEEGIYRVGGGCTPLAPHSAAADVSTRDGYGVGDKKVVPADLNGSTALGAIKNVEIPLRIPTTNYLNADSYNADLSESFANIGMIDVGMDGSTKLNGQPINNQALYGADCAPKTEGQ